MTKNVTPGEHSTRGAEHDETHHGGLLHDLATMRRALVQRRQMLRWALGASLLPLLACDGNSDDLAGGTGGTGVSGTGGAGTGGAGTGGAGTGGAGTGGATSSCSKIPEETSGPYPGDGSNGPNVLTQSGIVRSDIRSCFGSAVGTAAGIPLTVTLNLVNANGGCAALSGYAVYLWHCDQNGLYSLYSAGVTDKNYLRGVQTADANGSVSFTTIFPACYSGRWPHIHFEIYPSLTAATAASGKVATSQLALPKSNCDEVFATSGYSASVANLQQVSLATDNVFSDGVSLETPTVTGSASAGFAASMTVAVSG